MRAALPIFMPFYETREEQTFRSENARDSNQIPMNTLSDRVPSFLIQRNNSARIAEMKAINLAGSRSIDLLNGNASKFKCAETENGYYIYHTCQPLNFVDRNTDRIALEMPCDQYYIYIVFADNTEAWGELFQVSSKDASQLMKITMWNEGDINPIKYHGIDFKQITYLDTFFSRSEAELEQEQEQDGEGTDKPTFQKLTIKYFAEFICPDYFKNALLTMDMHDYVQVQDGNLTAFEASNIEIEQNSEDMGQIALVRMNFERIILTKNACEDNIPMINENVW